jgi:hypothetical protein
VVGHTYGLAQQGALGGELAVRVAAAGCASLLEGGIFIDTPQSLPSVAGAHVRSALPE